MQITIILEENELNIIGLWLEELPYKHSAAVLANIKKQYDIQNNKTIEEHKKVVKK